MSRCNLSGPGRSSARTVGISRFRCRVSPSGGSDTNRDELLTDESTVLICLLVSLRNDLPKRMLHGALVEPEVLYDGSH
jgi:hypothetical protein